MKIKHNDIVIDPQSPFANCKLDREKYAKVLTSIVSTYADGFVLAINNEWGTGKTTFVRMWERQLKNDGVHTLYFNAWENDFGTNPLAALISEMKPLVKKDNEKKYKTIIEKGTVITKHVLPKLVKAIAAKYVDVEALTDAIEGASEGLADILDEEVKDYTQKKEGLKEFRQALTAFVKEVKGDHPLIFIIDELDRCRPSYAVELLEQVKHFFSVEGIVFVLSIDKDQLGNAIRGFYGSDLINANEYLRRFIDLEYILPVPDTKQFIIYLYHYFGFNDVLLRGERRNIQSYQSEPDEIVDFASLIFQRASLTLRQQEKIFAHAKIALLSLKWADRLFPVVFIFLVYLKYHHLIVYKKIQNRSYSPQELIDVVLQTFPNVIDFNERHTMAALEAYLTFLYNNYISQVGSFERIFNKNPTTNQPSYFIKSNFDTSQGEFHRMLEAIVNNHNYKVSTLKHILDKIDLVESVNI